MQGLMISYKQISRVLLTIWRSAHKKIWVASVIIRGFVLKSVSAVRNGLVWEPSRYTIAATIADNVKAARVKYSIEVQKY